MDLPRAVKAPDEYIGPYAIFDEIAKGGMARVHLGRFAGPEGFSRMVAVKRMHPHLLANPEFKQMFLVEARLAARIRHPNVVPILDVQARGDELVIIMEYVHGESLYALLKTLRSTQQTPPLPIVSAIMVGLLQGLHAAHEAQDEHGEPLGIVHRDVSPHNVLVGADGVTRVLDFGIAKAVQARDLTPGSLKGKVPYMAPEVIRNDPVARQADVFSAGVVLWELLTGERLFRSTSNRGQLISILRGNYPSPQDFHPGTDAGLSQITMKALELDPEKRISDALSLAIEIERAVPPASQRVVGEWVMNLASFALDGRADLIHEVESSDLCSGQSSIRAVAGAAHEAEGAPAATGTLAATEAPPRAESPNLRRRSAFGAGIVALLLGIVMVSWVNRRSESREQACTPSRASARTLTKAPNPAGRPRALPLAGAPGASPSNTLKLHTGAASVALQPVRVVSSSSAEAPNRRRSPTPPASSADVPKDREVDPVAKTHRAVDTNLVTQREALAKPKPGTSKDYLPNGL